jgi:DNA modification methylase
MSDLDTTMLAIADLTPYHRNYRHGDIGAISQSLQALGQYRTIVVNIGSLTGRPYEVLAGNHTMLAAQALGWDELACNVRDVDDEECIRIVTADNRTSDLATNDDPVLAELLQELANTDAGLTATGYDDEDLDAMLKDITRRDSAQVIGPLTGTFGVPPFTVLDGRQGYWMDRKREWIAAGLVGEVGRDYVETYNVDEHYGGQGPYVSVFDPVLCEVAYRWFCPPGGTILDPFAGGPTRGCVATALGYDYTGIEVRPEQVAANRDNAEVVLGHRGDGLWIEGDAATLTQTTPGPYDLIFTCPPYYDLEEYVGGAKDGSMHPTYEGFLVWYRDIIVQAYGALADNRFAIYVVGDIRDPDGNYRNFVGDTVSAFTDAGFHYYNEAILISPVGSLAARVRKYMVHRKLGKGHQNVLVFYKGSTRGIRDHFPELQPGADWGDLDPME